MVSLTGFGQDGPYAKYKAPDIVGNAMGALLYISGDPSLPPCNPPETQSYYYASLFASYAVMLALWQRESRGIGAWIDASVQAIEDAARGLGAPEDVDPLLERPRESSHGDWATNLAMVLAKPLKARPREIAERLRDSMSLDAAGVSKVDIAGPGFMNFWIDAGRIASGLREIIAADESFGRSKVGAGRVVNVEFVSANPTGPLHVGHGRQAALGDAISTLLEVSQALSGTLNLKASLHRVLEILAHHHGAVRAGVFVGAIIVFLFALGYATTRSRRRP